ncbi:E-selectin-like [Xyrauchen texanus]|uniref:E-selectin-like n=1 Tax=Xyrauchen texanus TaxID=154827 RepID=UPI0022429660|nr:E-selectin-like [Xyrauchen texanus]
MTLNSFTSTEREGHHTHCTDFQKRNNCIMMKTGLHLVLLPALIQVALSLPHMFYYISVPMRWTDAQKYCRQHYVDLATIDDKTDVDDLVKAIPKDFQDSRIWTGLHKTSQTAPWIWSDQSNSMCTSWESGQPNNYGGNQLCVATSPAGLWNDLDCGTKLTSMCYSERSRMQFVRVEVKSSQNVRDPGVKTEILEKIQQILKENGLPENVKLTWRNESDGNIFQKKYQKKDTPEETCLSITNK